MTKAKTKTISTKATKTKVAASPITEGGSYSPSDFEAKWQKFWEDNDIYATPEPSPDHPKKYILDFFPYPSGATMHVGHMEGYVGTDVLARYYRAKGFSVLHPMGWDAFGLPAENFAIKNGISPQETTPSNIAIFKKQLALIGLSFDWSKEINSSDPSYYKWTQWLFLLFFKHGLAYRRKASANWCPSCETVLANEQVLNGHCERCDTEVVQRDLEQWFFNIVTYADRLIDGLEKIDWPVSTKTMQKNWIGKKEGVIITHKVKDTDMTIESFSAYPAWLYADSFIVMAPDHSQVGDLVNGTTQEEDVKEFVQKYTSSKLGKIRTKLDEKEGIFTGRYATDPLTGEEMPIWLANFALKDFGTGIIRCSSHDQRDVDFANKYGIKLKRVVGKEGEFVNAHENQGVLENSGPFSGREINPELISEMVDYFAAQGYGRREVTYHLRDWLLSRQRYWGAPIPMVFCQSCAQKGKSWFTTKEASEAKQLGKGKEFASSMAGWYPVPDTDLPILLPTDVDFRPTGESPVARSVEFQKGAVCPECGSQARREADTMDTFVDSSWYFLRYPDPNNNKEFASKESLAAWQPVDFYVGGAEHTVLHLMYSRFFQKVLFDLGYLPKEVDDEPFHKLRHQGTVLGPDNRKMSKRWGNVITPDDVVSQFGADTMRLYEMFMGPFDVTKPWNVNSVAGTYRFLARVYNLFEKTTQTEFHMSQNLRHQLNQTVSKVGSDIEKLKFNTAVATMMELTNSLEKEVAIANEKSNTTEDAQQFWSTFLVVLSPFAPYLTEELWHRLGVNGKKPAVTVSNSITKQSWPQSADVTLEHMDVIIPVLINGKLRTTLVVSSEEATSQAIVEEKTLANAKVAGALAGFTPKRIVFVPGKVINIVV